MTDGSDIRTEQTGRPLTNQPKAQRYHTDRAIVATLEEIDIRGRLRSRPLRPRKRGGEDRAAAALAKELAENPRNMLHRLVEIALELCDADSAGVSLLEGDGFRSEAVAGVGASFENSTTPGSQSPGLVEALLIPFHQGKTPVGTVWVVMHNHERKFDREDERVMEMLAQFASAGWQLWKAREQADAARREDDFLATLSHEFRNPLGAILAASHLVKAATSGNADIAAAAELIERQADHLCHIGDEILDVARISRGLLVLDRSPVTLQGVFSMALDSSRPSIAARAQELTIRLPPEPIVLDADPTRLAQVFSSLLDNASKYSPRKSQIAVDAEIEEGRIAVQVRDAGVGILPDQLVNLFQPFTRVDHPSSDNLGGLGLGLVIVRKLVELHGGTVEARSDGVDQGSEFVVRLPILSAGTPARLNGTAGSVREESTHEHH